MNRILLLSLFITCVFSTYATAQIRLSIEDTLAVNVPEGAEDVVGHNEFTNLLPQQRTLRWTRTVVDMTDGWQTAICDNNSCYTPQVDSRPIDLGPNASSILDVHVYPNEVSEGYAFIEVLIEDTLITDNNVTAFFIFDSNTTTSIAEVKSTSFKVYPNPTSGLFTLEDTSRKVKTLLIFSITGQQQKVFTVGERNWYDLSNLKQGTYIVQLRDEDNVILKTKLMTKTGNL